MKRDELIAFVLWAMRQHQDARIFGGLRFDAECIVDDYIARRDIA
jgi:hypothetical protein